MQKFLLLGLLLFVYGHALWAQASSAEKAQDRSESAADLALVFFPAIELQFFFGYQGLRSHEYVLGSSGNSRGHISELNWDSFKNLLLGAKITSQSGRWRYLAQLGTTLSLGTNYIYNYDWLYQNSPTQDAISHYSRHVTTQAILLELLLRLGYSVHEQVTSRITVGAGLFTNYVLWNDAESELRYFVTATGDLSQSTEIYSKRSLRYGVWLLAPHAYVEFIQNFTRNIELRLSVGYSPLTLWLDHDNHYRRQILFVDFGFFGQQILAEMQFNLWTRKRIVGFGVTVSGRYLFETWGSTISYNTDDSGNITSKKEFYNLASGVEQGSIQVSLNLLLALPKQLNKE